MSQSEAIRDLLETLEARGSQYGQPDDDKANLRGAIKVKVDPIVGAYIRSNDKHIRVQNLLLAAGGPGPLRITPEIRRQLRDNLLDIAGYSVKEMELLDEMPDVLDTPVSNAKGEPAVRDGAARSPHHTCLRAGCPICRPGAEKGPDVAPSTPVVSGD